MESARNKTVKGSNGNLYRDKQDNYRSYFLRMYLYIAHIWKMVKAKRPIAMNPSSAFFNSYEAIPNSLINKKYY